MWMLIFFFVSGLNGGAVYDDEQMAKPIKKFIAEYVRKQVCVQKGVTTYTLSEKEDAKLLHSFPF